MALYPSNGSLTTDKRTVDDTTTWDSQSDWEAYQSASNVEIVSGSVQLVEHTQPIPDSAILHWRMEDGSGSTVTDSVGSFDGSFVGDPQWLTDSAAVGGYSIGLDGDGDAIENEIRREDDYVAGVITIAPDSWDGSGFNHVVDGAADSSANASMILRNREGTLEILVRVGGSFVATGSSTPPTQTKTRVGYRYDGTDLDLFYNGTVESTTSQSGPLDNWVFNAVGYRKYNSGDGSLVQDREFDGNVDDFIHCATSTASELPDDQFFTDDYNAQPWV